MNSILMVIITSYMLHLSSELAHLASHKLNYTIEQDVSLMHHRWRIYIISSLCDIDGSTC